MVFQVFWSDTLPAGDLPLTPNPPFARGDSVNIQLEFSLTPETVEIIGGSLPPGLFYNQNSRTIQGTVGALPKNQSEYPIVFRASTGNAMQDRSFNIKVNPADIEHYWNDAGMTFIESYETDSSDIDIKDDYKIYKFLPSEVNSFYRGGSVNITLPVINSDGDKLSYKVSGFRGPVRSGSDTMAKPSYPGLPKGLKIDSFGRIIGAPTITDNNPGHYYFRVYIWEPAQASHGGIRPKTKRPLEGGINRPSPDQANTIPMSSRVFRIELLDEIRLDPALSDAVRWETPAGPLGSTYETFASHFAVKASPQYEMIGNVNEVQTIRYSLSLNSGPLPQGLYLDADTGMIVGRCPYVTGDRTYNIRVRAQIAFLNTSTGEIRQANVASERDFSFIIKSLYASDSVMTLSIAVPPLERLGLAKWTFGNQIEFNATDIEEGSSTVADGTQVLFPMPPRIAGKTNERASVLFDEVPTSSPFIRRIISGQEYVEFVTAPPVGTVVLVLRYGNQPHNLVPTLLSVLGNDNTFRPADPSWGKIRNLSILIATGITPPPSDGNRQEEIRQEYLDKGFDPGELDEAMLATLVRDEKIMLALRDYHHEMKLRFGEVKTAKAYDPSGRYVYDALYIEVIDPMANAGGFDNFGRDEILPKPIYQNKLNLPNRTGNINGPNTGEATGVQQWNLPQATDRYHPASIGNVRKDLLNKSNRLAWAPYNPSGPNARFNQSADERGLGITGKEGLPFWMDCYQIPGNPASRIGYVPAIEIAYLKPNTGEQVVRSLKIAGFDADLTGSEIIVDRYLILSDGFIYTSFIDDEEWAEGDTNHTTPILDDQFSSVCSFDGPDNTQSQTAEFTTFDLALSPISKYYKFPPGDRPTT